MRTPFALIPWLFALAAASAGLLWHAGDRFAGVGQVVVTGTTRVGGPFRLIDQTGRSRTDGDFRGRVMLVGLAALIRTAQQPPSTATRFVPAPGHRRRAEVELPRRAAYSQR